MAKGTTVRPNSATTKSTARSVKTAPPAKAATAGLVKTAAKPVESVRTSAVSANSAQMKGAATSGGARQIERQTVKPSKGLLKTAQEFKTKNWDRFRGQLNKALAKDPEFLKTTLATQENLRELKAGRNPHAPKDQAVGKRTKMEWDHLRERREGVNPTDARNLALKTPLAHTKKIAYKFNKDGGGIPASQSALFVKTGATKAPKQAVKPTATPAKDVSKTPMSYFKKPKAF